MAILNSFKVITLLLVALACCSVMAGLAVADEIAEGDPLPPPDADTSRAPLQFGWALAPLLEFSSGDTRYLSDQAVVASELIFPLDFKLIGVGVETRWWRNDRPDWTLSASFVTSINDPSDFFTDRDWYILNDGTTFDFSYSESHVEASMTRFELGVEKALVAGNKLSLGMLLGLEYRKIKQDAIDIDLTQMVYSEADSSWHTLKWNAELDALSYEVTSFTPKLGLAPRFILSPVMTATARLMITPLASVKDYDHHRLRFFEMWAEGRGFGWQIEGVLRYEALKAEGKKGIFIQFDGRYSKLKADPSAEAIFYADEPGYENDPESYFKAGTTILFLPHEITTKQFRIGLQVGMSY